MEAETAPAEEIPEEGTPERTRLSASALYRREEQAFGGRIQWEAAFFGWLAAIGLAAILVAMAIGGGVAVGLTELHATAGQQAKHLSVGGGIVLIAILALAYLAGGYVAARMSRFDGWRQGLGVWILSLLMAAALAVAAWIAGGDINPLQSLSLPRIPIDEGPLTQGGAIATAIIVLVTLASAIAGGVLGVRFHRAVDRAGTELPEAPEPELPTAAEELNGDQPTEQRSFDPDVGARA